MRRLQRAWRAVLNYGSSRTSEEQKQRVLQALEWCPPLYIAVMRVRRQGWQVVNRRTELVIEGYPCSANSFARRAMDAANPDARLASHLHSWAHVAQAVMLRKPVMVLIRAPEDAVASRIVRFDYADAARALRLYARFYRGVKPLRRRCVVAAFPEVTTRFGDVIGRVNDTYGTSFVPFDHDDPAATAAVFEAMDRHDERVADGIWTTARPAEERKAASAEARARLSAPGLRTHLARCQRLYEQMLSAAEPG